MTLAQTDLRALTRLAENAFAGPASHLGRGNIPSNSIGDGNDFLEFADYRMGDDVRLIDWRTTAKHEKPMVRKNRARAASRWTILLDCSASMRFGQRWVCASNLATAFATLLLHQSHRVGLVLFDSHLRANVPARSGALHLDEITSALSHSLPAPDGQVGTLFSALRHIVRPTGAVIISDLLWGDETENAIKACRTLGGRAHVVRLASPEDTAISSKITTVVDAETGLARRLTGTEPDHRSVAARRNLEALEARAIKACRTAGAIYSSASVAAGWKPALLTHLGHAARTHA